MAGHTVFCKKFSFAVILYLLSEIQQFASQIILWHFTEIMVVLLPDCLMFLSLILQQLQIFKDIPSHSPARGNVSATVQIRLHDYVSKKFGFYRNKPHLNKFLFIYFIFLHVFFSLKCANKSGEANLKRQTTTNSLVHDNNYNHLKLCLLYITTMISYSLL